MENSKPVYARSTVVQDYHLPIDGEISSDVSKYHEHLQIMRTATENDNIHIHINSGGGAVLTAMQYVNAMNASKAQITAYIEGQCASAATFIFLAASEWVVYPHSQTMIHNYSAWTGGIGNEGIEHAEAVRTMCRELATEMYTGFLTEKELDQVMEHNKTFWMTGTEVGERICAYADYRQESMNSMIREQQLAQSRAALPSLLKDPAIIAELASNGFIKVSSVVPGEKNQ